MKMSVSEMSKKNHVKMKQQIQIMLASPSAMRELIQYFETHGRLLDRQEPSDGAVIQAANNSSSFISCIRFNGVPILPPVMTNGRVEEVRQDRHNAAFKEKRLKVKQRKHLMAVANSLVENAETPGPSSETRPGKNPAARLPLERPPVLKPVVTSAWGSLAASNTSSTTAISVQSIDSVSALAASSLANTFATAEQGQEDFGLRTLDSVCSDFMSLEETLPTDFNGEPLTSVKQQKISHDLLRLSKVLKVKDCNWTGGSDVSELPSSDCGEDLRWGERVRNGGTSALDNVSGSFFHESQDTVVEMTGDNTTENTTTGFVDNSTDGSPAEISCQGDGNLSGVGSTNTSGMSSANTTGTTDSYRSSRSSPRSLKNNTVHFASFVTEYIDTSASLSSENITVVKKKLPSEQVAGNKQGSKTNPAAEAAGTQPNKEDSTVSEDLLSNVSLAEPDSPVACPVSSASLPFQTYAKADPSSSNKENDARQANKKSTEEVSNSSTHRSSHKAGVATNEVLPKGSASVTDSQGSSRSDTTAANSESSNSTLIEDAAAASRDSTNSLPLNIVESQEEGSAGKHPQKSTGSVPARKPKKLPPEPPQGAHQSAKQTMAGNAKHTIHQGGSATEGFKKGHVRRGSYTLSAPSPALVRAQGITGVNHGVAGEENKETQRRPNRGADEDHTKPLNIPLNPTVPSEPESTGKAEHINKYLSQVQLHNSEDMTASQVTADTAASTQFRNSFGVLQSLAASQSNLGSTGSEEALEQFQSLRQNLLEQQQKELEELFVQQRRQQMLLQGEIEEHQQRMKEQQDFLVSNAPENLKTKSQSHDGELSPDSNSGQETSVKRFNFPSPKQTQVNIHSQRGATAAPPSLLLLNNSSSSASPKVRRPVLRSPIKFHPGRRNMGRIVVPPEAYEPAMIVKFEKLTAAAKGFLCRCLIHSDKVQELVKTIKDTREFAFSFQSETPIRKGAFSNQDRTLLERIVAQLQAALLDIHEIFFDTPVVEQMALIEQTRVNNREKRLKSSMEESVRSSAPRISTATLKAQERRRRAQLAESTVFGSSVVRPRTSPSTTATSPRSVDLRSEKNRPHTAPEKLVTSRPKKPVSTGATGSNPVTDNVQPKLNVRPKQPQQQTAHSSNSKSSKRSKSGKSWR